METQRTVIDLRTEEQKARAQAFLDSLPSDPAADEEVQCIGCQ